MNDVDTKTDSMLLDLRGLSDGTSGLQVLQVLAPYFMTKSVRTENNRAQPVSRNLGSELWRACWEN